MSISTNPLSEEFRQNGFIHIKNVVDKADINLIQSIIKKNGTGAFVKDIEFFLSNEDLYRHQYNERISKALTDIYGPEYKIVNDVNIQVEQYYNDRPDKGWHIDAGHEFLARYLFKPEYGFCKVGIYTEANSIEFGGGIDVEIGGHKSFRHLGNGNIGYAASLVYYCFDRFFISFFRKKTILEIEPGDVVIFDSRLPHRSTPRQKTRKNKMNPKISIYWEIARDETNARIYMRTAMKLAATDENNFSHYCKYLGYHFPSDYPENYVEQSTKTHAVASLSENWASRYKIAVPNKCYEDAVFK